MTTDPVLNTAHNKAMDWPAPCVNGEPHNFQPVDRGMSAGIVFAPTALYCAKCGTTKRIKEAGRA